MERISGCTDAAEKLSENFDQKFSAGFVRQGAEQNPECEKYNKWRE